MLLAHHTALRIGRVLVFVLLGGVTMAHGQVQLGLPHAPSSRSDFSAASVAPIAFDAPTASPGMPTAQVQLGAPRRMTRPPAEPTGGIPDALVRQRLGASVMASTASNPRTQRLPRVHVSSGLTAPKALNSPSIGTVLRSVSGAEATELPIMPHRGAACSNAAWPGDFGPTPIPPGSVYYDPLAQQLPYDGKSEVPTQRPLIEWGVPFYAGGLLPRSDPWLGETNLSQPAFYVYGDYRIGAAAGRNAIGRTDNVAQRLNLDLDLRITATERFHAFVGPFNRAAQFSQARFVDGSVEFDPNFNLNPVTAFLEGDAGAILGGLHGTPSPFELPFTAGLVPLLFQNGIWMEDAVTGAAVALPAQNSPLLDWSNYDITGFAIVDQLNSPVFGRDQHAGQALGVAAFIEAYSGYIEAGYAYVHDRVGLGRSYHNLTASYTRRYFDRVSNSVRVIVNAGQDLPSDQRTADGALLLVENSFVTATPLTFVPYLNFFAGWDRPQSVARAGVSGEILRNVGLHFDPDGLNGHPTLDGSANNTAGGVIGVDLLGDALDRQLIIELAYLAAHGSDVGRIARGDQMGVAARYQFPISHATLLRFDAMYGARRNDTDIYGTRMEFRWKF